MGHVMSACTGVVESERTDRQEVYISVQDGDAAMSMMKKKTAGGTAVAANAKRFDAAAAAGVDVVDQLQQQHGGGSGGGGGGGIEADATRASLLVSSRGIMSSTNAIADEQTLLTRSQSAQEGGRKDGATSDAVSAIAATAAVTITNKDILHSGGSRGTMTSSTSSGALKRRLTWSPDVQVLQFDKLRPPESISSPTSIPSISSMSGDEHHTGDGTDAGNSDTHGDCPSSGRSSDRSGGSSERAYRPRSSAPRAPSAQRSASSDALIVSLDEQTRALLKECQRVAKAMTAADESRSRVRREFVALYEELGNDKDIVTAIERLDAARCRRDAMRARERCMRDECARLERRLRAVESSKEWGSFM